MEASNSPALWEVLVPRYSNDQVEYPLSHHQAWDGYVRSLAGGLTILKPAKGQWVSPTGTLFHDEMIPVRVLCAEPSIDAIVDFTLTHYDQEAVLAYRIADHVKLQFRR